MSPSRSHDVSFVSHPTPPSVFRRVGCGGRGRTDWRRTAVPVTVVEVGTDRDTCVRRYTRRVPETHPLHPRGPENDLTRRLPERVGKVVSTSVTQVGPGVPSETRNHIPPGETGEEWWSRGRVRVWGESPLPRYRSLFMGVGSPDPSLVYLSVSTHHFLSQSDRDGKG